MCFNITASIQYEQVSWTKHLSIYQGLAYVDDRYIEKVNA
jgi:hypothetical protein